MPENRQPGKLAVILHADVAGSTLLVQQDEHLAHERIQDTFRRFSDTIAQYHGHVRELRGDALLAEFERASDAVSATLAFQANQLEYTTQLNDNILPMVRVGIAMGEVIIADNTVTGEGVVLAQRVEQLAKPGGLCITGAINEALPTRLPFDQKSLGERKVKGFYEPIRVYSVTLRPGEVMPSPGETQKSKATNTLGLSAAVAAIILVIAGGVAFWFQPWSPEEEPASVERMAFPIPEKPSIAVLPFDNLSGDPDQEFLADGLSEEIITVLSKVPNLFVIARNSTFTYKGKAVSVKQVAEEQGVRYVLEGSVQRSGDRIRINAQLIDALKGHHLWAERYDREFKDIFALQDDITQNIMVALQVELTEGEEMRYLQKRAGSPEAFEYFQKSRVHFQRFNKEDNAISRQLMSKAIELSPDNPTMLAWLAWNDFNDARFGWSADREVSIAKAVELGDRAYALDPLDVKANAILGAVKMLQGHHDEAIAYQRKAVELAPSDAIEIATLAWILCYSGNPEQAIPLLEQAMRLSPYYPAWFTATLGLAYFMTGDYDKAIAAHEHLIERKGMLQFAYSRLAGINAILGNEEKAQEYAAELLTVRPEFTIESWSKALLYRNPEDLERELNALRVAGLPEKPPLAFPDKPSIAVLPFTNMSGDPEQEYFADGMTDDLITDLSKISDLFVIARNSSFAYKDQSPDVRQVSRDLGVKYILEGSVRRIGGQVRINAQLIDATTGGHLWAERYDGALADVFELQDNVREKIVASLALQLTPAERGRIARGETKSIAAYDAFLQGWEHLQRHTPDEFAKALPYLQNAIELDGNYSRAYSALAWLYFQAGQRWWHKSLGLSQRREALNQANRYLEMAMTQPTALAHRVTADKLWQIENKFDEAVAEAERAIKLDPGDPVSYAGMARALIHSGRPDEAIEAINTAMRLDPHYPPYYLFFLGLAHFTAGQLEKSTEVFERALERNPEYIFSSLPLAAAYAHLDREQDAQKALAIFRKVHPKGPHLRYLRPLWPFKRLSDADRFFDGLRKAGVAE